MPTRIGQLGVTFPDNTVQTTAAVAGTAGFGGFHNIQLFTSNSFWLCPAGVYKVMATVVGGGGGGWNGPNPTDGSAGGIAVGIYTVIPGTTYNVVIGSGGTPVSGSGGNGGTSSFGSFCSATGGTGGTNSGNGTPGSGLGGNLRNTYVHGGVTGFLSGFDFSGAGGPWSINSPNSPGAAVGPDAGGGVGGVVMLEY